MPQPHMCLAVPVQIVEVDGANAVVEAGGVRRQANLAFVSDAIVGDYVLLHAGFAIKKWTEQDVREFNALMSELDAPDQGKTP